MYHYPICCLTIMLALAAGATRVDAAIRIENDRYGVSIEAADGSFTIASVPGGRKFLTSGRLAGTGGTAKTVVLADPALGHGQGIEIVYPDGNREVAGLYDGLPFVTFRSTLHNGGTEAPVLLAQSPVLTPATLTTWNFNLDLNARIKELRLVVTDGGDGIAADHANWANPGFVISSNENH